MAGSKSISRAHYAKGKCMAYARECFGQKKNAGLMMCFHEAWAWAVQFTRLKSLASLGWNLLHEAKLRARAVYVFDIGLTFDLTSLIPCKNHSFRKVLQLWCYVLYCKRKDKIVIITLNSFTQKVELEKGKIYSTKHSRFLLKLS